MRIRLFILRLTAVVFVAGFMRLLGQNLTAAPQPNVGHLQDSNPAASNSVPGASAIASQFVLGIADVTKINVWKNTDLSQAVTIGPDGFVSLPLLGDVHVTGMTANQLAQDLKSRLSSYVVDSQVTVGIVDIRSKEVYVTGQAGRPGGYPLIVPISALQLIAQAGGLNTFANRKDIVILRGSGGHLERLKFNYNSACGGTRSKHQPSGGRHSNCSVDEQ